MQFLDEAKIFIKSGDGGPGCLSFLREKFMPFGGPDGGDGGRGGSVVVECVGGLNTLIDFRYKQHFKAKNGEGGKGKERSGISRPDLIIPVPVGTQILDEDRETMIADLTRPGQRVLLAKGGDGGFGNAHFKSSTNQSPRHTTPGWPGEEKWLWLRLKLLSDAGLVGMPNAGKSTLLASVTRAKPKIADYPFSTLKPQLGVVYADGGEFVLADLPGLIEGAHEGAGLGTRFLGHVERCGVLVHLIDGTAEDVAANYKTIRNELKEYGNGLDKKKEFVVLNKCDSLAEEEAESKLAALKKCAPRKPIFAISSVSGKGVDELIRAVGKEVRKKRKDTNTES